jgi:hypothetical protein
VRVTRSSSSANVKRLFLAALVEVDQRRVRTAAVGDVVIERVIREVGLLRR